MSDEKLTEEQLNSVVEFSKGMWAIDRYGYYTPWMQNQLLNNLNNNAKKPTLDKIKQALADYKTHAEDLQDYTEFMEKWDMIFERTLLYYANMLSFDLQIVCKDAFTESDYKSKEYKEDKKRVYKFLDSFDYKAEFKKMLLEMLRHETVYTWFRKTKWGNKGMKSALQILPQKYCMLTNYWDKGMLFDFDVSYFLQPGVDIDGFDPVFKKYFKKVFGDKNLDAKYNPTNQLNKRKGTYGMWTQTSPQDGAWVFKFNTSNFSNTPFLAPFLKQGLKNEDIESLQYNKDLLSASGILAGEIRLFDNAKSGVKQDQFSINPSTLGAFMGKVKQGLPNNVICAAMPTENTDFYQYTDNNKNMYGDQLKNSAGIGSSGGRIVFSNDKLSNLETQCAIENDYQIVRTVYSQFNNFLNYYVNKITKKYHFNFIFDGSNYEIIREKNFERIMKISDKGIVLNSSAYASVIGMRPQDFDRSLAEGHCGEFIDNLSMLLNANTMKDGGAGGRPSLSNDKITDSGEASRNSEGGLN